MLRRNALLTLLIAGIAATALGFYAERRASAPRTPADHAAAAFFDSPLTDARGARIDLSALRGQPVVINFWAPWCSPCVAEMPELSALAQTWKGSAGFIGIGIDSARNIQAFLDKLPVAYPIAAAGFSGTELGRQLGNEAGGLPFTVVLDAQGHIVFRKMGRVQTAELQQALQRT